jgi:hypothetical protein
MSEIKVDIKERFWNPQPAYSHKRQKTLALVYHWGCSYAPKIGRVANLDEMWTFYQRTLKDHSYHAFVRFNILQTMPWDMTGGALGLTNIRFYPEEAVKKFGITTDWSSSPDEKAINILMMEEDEEGRYDQKTIYNAQMLGAFLCAKYQLDPINDVLRHTDVTHKGIRPIGHFLYSSTELPCPRFYVEHENLWMEFKLRIKEICCLAAEGVES